MQQAFDFYRNHWFRFTLPACGLIVLYMLLQWESLSHIQVLVMLNMMALLLHTFETYVYPGGVPVMINMAVFDERKDALRYPLNMLTVMVADTLALVAYLLAMLSPQWVGLGMATMGFGVCLFIGLGVQINRTMKTWYAPGLASAVCLMLPLAVYYVYYVASHDLTAPLVWIQGVLGCVLLLVLAAILPVLVLKNRKTPFEIPTEQWNKSKAVYDWARIQKRKRKNTTEQADKEQKAP